MNEITDVEQFVDEGLTWKIVINNSITRYVKSNPRNLCIGDRIGDLGTFLGYLNTLR